MAARELSLQRRGQWRPSPITLQRRMQLPFFANAARFAMRLIEPVCARPTACSTPRASGLTKGRSDSNRGRRHHLASRVFHGKSKGSNPSRSPHLKFASAAAAAVRSEADRVNLCNWRAQGWMIASFSLSLTQIHPTVMWSLREGITIRGGSDRCSGASRYKSHLPRWLQPFAAGC